MNEPTPRPLSEDDIDKLLGLLSDAWDLYEAQQAAGAPPPPEPATPAPRTRLRRGG